MTIGDKVVWHIGSTAEMTVGKYSGGSGNSNSNTKSNNVILSVS
jgi:hypothetical protein